MSKQALTSSLALNKTFVSLSILAFALVAFFVSTPSFAADAKRGESLSQTCLGCHGAPGLRNPGPVYNIPVLGGQKAVYIVDALKGYKNKDRSHGTMQAQAANLSDQDMQDIAAYFSSLKSDTSIKEVSLDGAPELYATCQTCHSVKGDSTGDFPILNGQYKNYLAQALKDYRSGDRKNMIMAPLTSNLTIQQINEISEWYAKQQGKLVAPKTQIFK